MAKEYHTGGTMRQVFALDDLFSKYIRLRDNNICITCGKQLEKGMECGHLFSRVNTMTRFDERFAFCQCHECNRYHEANRNRFDTVFINRYGEKLYAEGLKLAGKVKIWSLDEMDELAEKFKSEIKRLGG